jgi:hypothetical protein
MINQTLQNPNTEKKQIKKKQKNPRSLKEAIKDNNKSHSIKNFINVGKPLKIKTAHHIKNVNVGKITDNPLNKVEFLV